MKKLALVGAMLMVFPTFALAQGATTYTGQIMDEMCANMGGHEGAYKMTHTDTPKDCTLACVKLGSPFVLYNKADKTTYKLDNQSKPKQFAGQDVKVKGTLNKSTHTIHVESMEPAS